jgi:hypothetical protein
LRLWKKYFPAISIMACAQQMTFFGLSPINLINRHIHY